MSREPSTTPRIVARRSPELGVVVGPRLGHDPWSLAFVLVGVVVAACILALLTFLATHEIEGATARWRQPGAVLLLTPLVVVVGAVPFALVLSSALFRMYGRQEVVLTRHLLTVVTVLGPLRRARTFPLADVSNIRWRELSARTKRGSYTVRTVSFDVGKRTVDVGTPLSFPDAHHLERELRSAFEDGRQDEAAREEPASVLGVPR